jgi:AcrR family transcriptional regulator
MKMSTTKGEITREHVLQTALKLFRKRGFEQTTMRDIAHAAGLSLGAAYHYFPSKEAFVGAYYEWMQTEHERLFQSATATNADLRTRIAALLETKLDLLRGDAKLLAALFGHLGDPSAPLSLFGKKTAALRKRSVAQFVAVFDEPATPEELRALLGHALWLAHLGVFLFFIHDRSPKRVRTQTVIEAVVDLFAGGAPLLGHPLAGSIRRRLLDVMTDLDPGREGK